MHYDTKQTKLRLKLCLLSQTRQQIYFFSNVSYVISQSWYIHVHTSYKSTSTNFFSTYFVTHVQTHNYQTRNAQDYSNDKTKKMFSDRAIRNC